MNTQALPDQQHAATGAEKPLLNALHGRAQSQAPFWFMRQAGRYLPEYRDLRKTAGGFLDLCFNPDFAVEVTLQPIRRFNMDAAILFSDILVIPYALGQKLEFLEGEGPNLGPFNPDALAFDDTRLAAVYETLRRLRADLPADKTLIGFAGAPWTIACYMVQGHGDGAFNKAKIRAYKNPDAFDKLINMLVEVTAQYLIKQAQNGADALQLFDSWAGLLPEPYFTRWVTTPARKIRELVATACPGVPLIGFPRGAGSLYEAYAAHAGVNCIGLDTQVDMQWAAKALPHDVCLQGNLDPVLLLTGGKAMRDGAERIMTAMQGRPFIFNLGHGVIKETPPEHVAELSSIIREFRA
ncbi:MAG: uroporphyrinogen decarboxylase [Micavibrio sp.]|nr:uroporphyrinogen decarboxylase [Micavibrio sp.]